MPQMWSPRCCCGAACLPWYPTVPGESTSKPMLFILSQYICCLVLTTH